MIGFVSMFIWTGVVISFSCQLDTNLKEVREEGTSIEEMPSSYGPWTCPWSIFLVDD